MSFDMYYIIVGMKFKENNYLHIFDHLQKQ